MYNTRIVGMKILVKGCDICMAFSQQFQKYYYENTHFTFHRVNDAMNWVFINEKGLKLYHEKPVNVATMKRI